MGKAGQDPFAKAAAKEVKKLSSKAKAKLELQQYRAKIAAQEEAQIIEQEGVSKVEQRRQMVQEKQQVKKLLTELKRRRSKLDKRSPEGRAERKNVRLQIAQLEGKLKSIEAGGDAGAAPMVTDD